LSPADQPPRRLHFELHGDKQDVVRHVEAIEAFLRDAGCNAASVGQFAIVAEEILTNIVREAWAGRESGHCTVEVEAVARADGIRVSMRTEDDGSEFDPTQAEPPDLEASLDERSVGGLGILFIRTMTDTQAYRRANGRNIFEVSKVCPLP
jgi:serine/threonine-protein kinase RsbW